MSAEHNIRLEFTAPREMYGHKVTNVTVLEDDEPLFAERLYLDEEKAVTAFEERVRALCNGNAPADLHKQIMGQLKPPAPRERSSAGDEDDPQPYQGAPRPRWDAGGGDLAVCTWRAYDAIERTNDPPNLFCYQKVPAEIDTTHKVGPEGEQVNVRGIAVLDQDQLRSQVADRTRPYKENDDGDQKPCFPTPTIVSNMMCTAQTYLPEIRRLVYAPIVTAQGEILTQEGYHPLSKIYLALANGVVVGEVPAAPTKEHVAWAVALYRDLFFNFPFVTDPDGTSPSFAHAMALVLEQFARELIDGPLPLHVFEAPAARTGKTLLAVLCCIPFVGHELALNVLNPNEEERKKELLAFMLSGQAFYFLDNVKHRVDSAALCAGVRIGEEVHNAPAKKCATGPLP